VNNEDYTNHLQVLGVDHDSSWSDIKTAFQRAAREWHPDRYIAEPEKQKLAEERFKIISQAYNALSNYYQHHGKLPEGPAQAQGASPVAGEQDFEIPLQPDTSIWSGLATEEERMLRHIIVRRSAVVLLSIGAGIALLNLFLSADGPSNDLAADRPYTAGKPLGGNGPGSRPLNTVRLTLLRRLKNQGSTSQNHWPLAPPLVMRRIFLVYLHALKETSGSMANLKFISKTVLLQTG